MCQSKVVNVTDQGTLLVFDWNRIDVGEVYRTDVRTSPLPSDSSERQRAEDEGPVEWR